MLVCDPSGQIHLCNLSAQRLLKRQNVEQSGKKSSSIRDVLPAVQVAGRGESIEAALLLVLDSGEAVSGEVRCDPATGEPSTLHLKMIPLREQGVSDGVLILLHDAPATQKDGTDSQTLSPTQVIQWTASVAHEIRNPLSAIGNCIEILDKQLEPQGDIRELIQIALGECERLDRVLSNLLSFARRKSPVRQPAQVCELVERVLTALPYDTRFHPSIRLERDFSAPTQQTLWIDRDQISQVLWNLLINAMHAMPEGGQLTVSTRIAEDRTFRLGVRDTGIGMSLEVIEKALQPFFTTKMSGTGLGLATAKEIIAAHGGRLVIQSEEGKGTEVIIWLPLPDPA
jgi:signal transduction histidine kinase